MKENLAPKKALSIETIKGIVKIIQESNRQWSVAKDVVYSQSAESKIWCEYKRNRVVKEGKHTYWPRKTLKRKDRKLKAWKIENLSQSKWKTNRSKQDQMFVTELWEISWIKWDLHRIKPNKN